MKTALRVLALAAIMAGTACSLPAQQPSSPAAGHWAIVVHGGAGVIERASMKPEAEAAYRASLAQADEAGAKVLDQGGSAARCGRGRNPDSRRRSALQRRPRRGLHRRGQERTGRVHHGRLESEGRRGGRSDAHPPSHQPGARGDGKVAARDADRRGRRRLCRAGRPGAGGPQLLLHREPLAIAGEAAAEGGPPDAAASGRRAAAASSRAGGCRSTNGPTRTATAPWAWWRSTAQATSPRAPRPAACRPRCRAASATRRSSARAPTPPINPAPSPPPAPASTSSASAWRARSATWWPSRA